ncbi:hypothetical protein [Roseateles violae]|uniref:Uncharacterized protein n=1 Tax=Roseateles violae TaxID=3058042 RepID=A0ABT8DVA5_9BURK|nr:hypothetical protein [Pelomonas sp. PFR6]MDN3922224.1 hypothetical protein [Pelomonas sp. PFR6]
MKRARPLLAAALLALPRFAGAEIVPVQWDAAGRFGREIGIAPGQFLEVCEKLPEGGRVAWSFEAAGPLDFNIHYHEGSEVRFPAQKAQIARDEGLLTAALKQDFCWMWTNKAAAPLVLRFRLEQR